MSSIKLEQHDTWRKVVLNRPDRLNSFNAEMLAALMRALEEAASDTLCRAILLTGEGRAFCAGQDLNDRVPGQAGEADLGQTIERFYNPLVRCLRSLPKPIICAVNGVAAGAGANIALACDIVLAARSAIFIQAFAKIGLVPDSGGTFFLPRLIGFFLPRLIGEARARALALMGDALPAETAAVWGLIWKVVDDGALLPEAEALTSHLATQPTQGLGLIKHALAASAGNTFDAQLDLERDLQRQAGRTPDYSEGVRAFLEKRQPKFTGQP